MKLSLTASTIVFLFTSISTSFAGGCGNNSHMHTKEEIAEKYFDQMDLNSDLTIDFQEYKNSNMSKILKSFDSLNPDKNGVISKKSFIKNFVKAHSELVNKT